MIRLDKTLAVNLEMLACADKSEILFPIRAFPFHLEPPDFPTSQSDCPVPKPLPYFPFHISYFTYQGKWEGGSS
jgi:hypothetical protein